MTKYLLKIALTFRTAESISVFTHVLKKLTGPDSRQGRPQRGRIDRHHPLLRLDPESGGSRRCHDPGRRYQLDGRVVADRPRDPHDVLTGRDHVDRGATNGNTGFGQNSGTDVMIFRIFLPKNLAKILAFLTQNKASFYKNCDHNIGF
jgi:hypothetical protein